MPSFFDFTNQDPMGMSAPSTEAPGWGGDLMGQPRPIVPDNYDIFSQSMPQMPQQPQGGGMVPYDALGAMAGIQMPQMPAQDDLGRYGITDGQNRNAGMQSLAQILFGAGQSLIAEDPSAVMQAAGKSGDTRRSALDGYSKENIEAFKLKVEAKAKELDFINKKSDIEKQQMQIEQEQMKLEDMKTQRKVAVAFGEEMAPVMSDLLKKTAAMYPDKVPEMKGRLLTAQGLLAAGDLAGAEKAMEEAKLKLPVEWQKQLEEDMIKQTLEAGMKYGLAIDMANDPALKAKAAAAGGVIEMGEKGPVFLSAYELQQRKQKTDLVNAQINQINANAEYYRQGGSGGGAGRAKQMTPNEISNTEQEIAEAAGRMLQPPPDITDANAVAKWKQERAEDEAMFKMYRIDPQDWLTMDPEKRKAIITGQGIVGGQAQPQPTQQGGGPIPAAREGLFMRAREADAKTKRDAIAGLANSGDQRLSTIAKNVMAKYPKFNNEAEFNAGVAAAYAEILNQLKPQKR